MKLLWNYLIKYKKLLAGALILATINRVFSLLDPQIFRLIIDNYATRFQEHSQSDFINGVLLLLAASVGVAMVSRIAKTFQDYYVNVITERLGTKLYADAVSHAFSLPYSVFEDQRSGETLLKLEKARDDAKKLIANVIDILFFSLIGILFVLIYALTVHWSLGLTFFMMIPLLGATTYFISRGIKEAQSRIVNEQAGLAGSTTETLRNVQLVKSLGLEEQEVDRLNLVNEEVLQLELEKVKLVRRLSFIQGTIVNGLRSALLLLMLWLIFLQIITLGEFFSLMFYSFFIFGPLQELGILVTNYRESQASMQQLQEILNRPRDIRPEHPREIKNLNNITFDKVSLKYESAQSHSVADISLEIKAGETIAFVGPSGSGKSTLIKLLVGLYKPTSGLLKYNDLDVADIDFMSLRQRIGLVAQETQLFTGTIRDNLLFVKPDSSDAECLKVLEAAAVDDILTRGKQGLDTKIGEGGIKLSGGERQRLAIARALLRKPELLIFDEATSSLDSITEKSITKTIKKIEEAYPNLIRILVSHRLSTVRHADKIYVMKDGRIEESGKHDDLINKSGLYSALWRQQS